MIFLPSVIYLIIYLFLSVDYHGCFAVISRSSFMHSGSLGYTLVSSIYWKNRKKQKKALWTVWDDMREKEREMVLDFDFSIPDKVGRSVRDSCDQPLGAWRSSALHHPGFSSLFLVWLLRLRLSFFSFSCFALFLEFVCLLLGFPFAAAADGEEEKVGL